MNYKPARVINNIRSRKNTGLFPSIKNNRPILFESLLERDFLYLVEFDQNVSSYEEQPFTLEYFFRGKKYKYTPDFLIRRKHITQIVEVKPRLKLEELLKDETKRRGLEAGHNHCITKNYEFKVVTDEDIYMGTKLTNIKYLFMFSQVVIPAKEFMKVRKVILETGLISIKDLLKSLNECDNKNYLSLIYSMMYFNKLKFDLNKPIMLDTKVWL